MTDAHDGTGSHQNLVATLLSMEGPIKNKSVRGQLDLGSMKLESKNVAMVVPNWVMTVKFMPCSSMRMVVAGDKVGNVGFWNMDSEEGNDGRCLYRPHSGPISGILFPESCISQMFTSCYNGYVRMMDLEKGEFILVRERVERLNCLSKPPNDDKSLYMAEGRGVLTVWDTKSGKPSLQLDLHSHLINTIDFNPGNSKVMATGARDKTAKIWDLRFIRKGLPRCLKEVKHKGAVNSAYFSPSGAALATLSLDDYVGIQNGTNWDVSCMIPHVHGHSVRYIPKLRAIWGWDDSCIFVGSMDKAIDVISPVQRGVVMSLDSPNMGTVPCRFDAHPQRVGLLAGAAAGGNVYVWTCS
ncbi:unnamed protein product [Linum tenue]|uniref:Uncharacterized protein n=1 Tax=Linum tenue TaxID=586396 RepID=A0AAV0KTF6_9ROSI|nr:unnamed protein product [Linum tenue]